MAKTGKRLTAVLLAVAMVITFMPASGSLSNGKVGIQTVYAEEQEPAAIQETYEIDGVTYYNTGSSAFATNNPARFYKELLGTRTEHITNNNKSWSLSDMWLGLSVGIYYHLNNTFPICRTIESRQKE